MELRNVFIARPYENRKVNASPKVTILKMASKDSVAMRYGMLTRLQFLDAVRAVAKSQAEIARVIGVSEAAASLIFKGVGEATTAKGKPRKLTYDEAVKLADYYGIDPNAITVEKLMPVLRMLVTPPPAQWTDQIVARFAEDLIFGLELLRYSSSIAPTQEAIDVAARAIADRRRRTRGGEGTST